MNTRPVFEKPLKNLPIGVIAGGDSAERGVSLRSGRSVFTALRDRGFKVAFFDVSGKDALNAVVQTGIRLVFIALHGRFGEDGSVQRYFEEKQIPYTGSGPEASSRAIDKLVSKKYFDEVGLATAPAVVYNRMENPDPEPFCADEYPVVVKPRHEGSSIGLGIDRSTVELKEMAEKAFTCYDDILVEQFIPGRELSVGILDGGALPVIEILPRSGVYDYQAKYHDADAAYRVPAELKERQTAIVQSAAERAHQSLGCAGFSRVDMRFRDDGTVFILEVNTIPGLTERSLFPKAAKAQGIDFGELCERIILQVGREHSQNGANGISAPQEQEL